MPVHFALAQTAAGAAEPAVTGTPVPAADQPVLLVPARLQYYNLQSHGVKSYACDVDFDWSGFFKIVAGTPLAADDPMLVYLQGSRMHLVSDLDGPYEITWGTAGPPPAGKESAIASLRDGLKQMVGGFLEAWTPSLNGNLYPVEAQSMRKTASGYELREVTPEQTVVEQISPDMLLQSIAVTSAANENKMAVTFSGPPKALLLTSMGGDYRESAGGPSKTISMKAAYQTVDGVQIPATLKATVTGIAGFDFKFVGCTVTKVVLPKPAD